MYQRKIILYINVILKQHVKSENAYLYDDEQITDSEYQRNIRDIETLINDAIDITIRNALPIRNLLEEYLGKDLKVLSIRDDDVTSMSL